jgi:hypothetical protein
LAEVEVQLVPVLVLALKLVHVLAFFLEKGKNQIKWSKYCMPM